jgi:hypothetical protein
MIKGAFDIRDPFRGKVKIDDGGLHIRVPKPESDFSDIVCGLQDR